MNECVFCPIVPRAINDGLALPWFSGKFSKLALTVNIVSPLGYSCGYSPTGETTTRPPKTARFRAQKEPPARVELATFSLRVRRCRLVECPRTAILHGKSPSSSGTANPYKPV